jgi:hypothetical protein
MKILSVLGFRMQEAINSPCLITHCRICKEKFSALNTRTSYGWQKTQTEQICENCFEDECNQRLYGGYENDE